MGAITSFVLSVLYADTAFSCVETLRDARKKPGDESHQPPQNSGNRGEACAGSSESAQTSQTDRGFAVRSSCFVTGSVAAEGWSPVGCFQRVGTCTGCSGGGSPEGEREGDSRNQMLPPEQCCRLVTFRGRGWCERPPGRSHRSGPRVASISAGAGSVGGGCLEDLIARPHRSPERRTINPLL